MNKLETFESFLASQSVHVPIFDFVVNLFLAALVAHLLSLIYVRYGNALSNRSVFSKNLVIITMTTTVVITIIKSSLALSLGLIGALSIVRFRTPVKEPEELIYLFFSTLLYNYENLQTHTIPPLFLDTITFFRSMSPRDFLIHIYIILLYFSYMFYIIPCFLTYHL